MTENRRKNKRAIGTKYEQYAGACLEKQGFRVLQYNYRCKKGEVDIVAEDGEYLVFCEVKYRAGKAGAHPAEAVDIRKQRRLSACAVYYLAEKGQGGRPCRFDVVSIAGDEITLLKDAFDYQGGSNGTWAYL